MIETEKITPEQLEGVHLCSTRELEDDDELYEFDQLCLERPEEVLINELDDSPRKPESSLPR
jgi:hypothetical protein